ncbi:response regulator [Herbidospora sp. RD11066]
MTIKVLLADDEMLIRAGVKAILDADAGIDVVAEASNGREAVERTLAHRPDVVLMDIRMPVLDGLAAAAEIRKVAPATGVVMLTTFGEDEYIARALKVGAGGFLLKSGDPRELLAGIHAVAGGAAYLSPKVAARVIAELNNRDSGRAAAARGRVSALTPREREVLELVGAGLSNQAIARSLRLTEGTVKTYVSAILTRLGVTNRVQAAIVAYEAGAVSFDD